MLANITPKDTKVLSLGFYTWCQTLEVIRKNFPWIIPRNHKSVEQDQLRRRMNQFPDLQPSPLDFFRQKIFSFQLVENIDGHWSGWKL